MPVAHCTGFILYQISECRLTTELTEMDVVWYGGGRVDRMHSTSSRAGMCVLYHMCCLCIREHQGPVSYVENCHEPRKRTSLADFLEPARRAFPRGSGSPRE